MMGRSGEQFFFFVIAVNAPRMFHLAVTWQELTGCHFLIVSLTAWGAAPESKATENQCH